MREFYSAVSWIVIGTAGTFAVGLIVHDARKWWRRFSELLAEQRQLEREAERNGE